MKFTIEQKELSSALQEAVKIAGGNKNLFTIGNLLLKANDGALTVRATDLEINEQHTLDISASAEGEILVPAKLLADVVKKLPKGEIIFESNGSFGLKFSAAKGRYKISGADPEEFPLLPEMEEAREITLARDKFRRAVGKVSFALNPSENRMGLTGINFRFSEDCLKAVATDGHRLGWMKITLDNGPDANVIIPGKVLDVVSRKIRGDEDMVITIGKRHIKFDLDGLVIFGRLIDEEFVDFERVIPAGEMFNYRIKVDTGALRASVKRLALFTNSPTAVVVMDIRKDTIHLRAEDIDFGSEGKETLACTNEGEPLKIGFNIHYLYETLAVFESKEVLIKVVREDYAIIFEPPVQLAGETHFALVMPVRLDD